VVDGFRQRGVVFVEDLGEVPEGAPLLYSAHGVAPEVRDEAKRRRLLTIDATCPLVTKVHREAIRYAEEGYTIVLIGHQGHDEVIGTMGEAPQSIRLVRTLDDVDRLEVPDPARVAYLTQTTLSVDEASQIVARLRERFPQIVGPSRDDICYATQNRQRAVRQLSARADFALVVGSRNSSNSQRLAELARSVGIPAQRIDDPSDIDPAWFSGNETVMITAGASAPETLVQDCVDYLQRRFQATVESRSVCEEQVRFPLPKALRGKETDSACQQASNDQAPRDHPRP
jgi:4-hydroxy-3-methylbut-2-enyl diphosphate reductase